MDDVLGPGPQGTKKLHHDNSDGSHSEAIYTGALEAKVGALTETAPAGDTASSGLNGRLQRIAQRLTSLIALLPATLGQTTKANSLSVTPASDYVAPTYGAIDATTFDLVRLPNVVKTAVATASGNTALWTPTSGKKFRLMRVRVEVTADAARASGGIVTIDLKDGATNSTGATFSVFVPTLAATSFGNGYSGWLDLGNGVLSSAANNVLNINLSAALTSGTVRVIAAGTEEA